MGASLPDSKQVSYSPLIFKSFFYLLVAKKITPLVIFLSSFQTLIFEYAYFAKIRRCLI
jgi:hypothetical protein